MPPHLGPFLGVVIGLSLVAHLVTRWRAPNANPVILPLAALLNGLGYCLIARWDPSLASLQATWTALGVGFFAALLVLVGHSRDLDRYRYILLLLGAFLLLSPLIPHVGYSSGGARLWVHLGSLNFQPVEFGKLCLCVFFASYFAQKKELLSIPTARVGNRLFLDPRPLIPILLAWGFAMLVIIMEHDIGFAMLLFVLFIGMLWVTTGRIGYLVLGAVLFAVGAVFAAHTFGQVHERVTIWLDPWKTQLGTGYQLANAWYALGTGGVGGTGLGHGAFGPTLVPFLTSDMIFVAVGEELGLLGSAVVVFAFLLFVGSGLRIAQTARSDFAKLLATGLTILIGFQAFFIMAGVLRLLPLTGITLPFMAYGGSSLVANYLLVAMLLRVSDDASAFQQTQLEDVPRMNDRPLAAAH